MTQAAESAKRERTESPDDKDDESLSEEEIDVDFDYFDPQESDFLAVKNLLKQLFDVDAIEFNLSELAELVVQQKPAGSMIKTDGIHSDPFAMLKLLPVTTSNVLDQLTKYAISRTGKTLELNRKLRQLFTSGSSTRVGVILSERLVNMPVQVVPPMYRMLLDEISPGKPFDYYLIFSKGFREVKSKIDDEDSRHIKSIRANSSQQSEVYDMHPEDSILDKYSSHRAVYEYKNETQNSDSRRAFNEYGMHAMGKILLMPATNLPKAASDMASEFPIQS